MSTNADMNGGPDSRTDGSTERSAVRLSSQAERQDGSQAAARLLAMTARDTDHWRTQARQESDAMVADARKESAELVRAARDEAERLVASAREEAAQTTNDARVEAYRIRAETTALRERHDEDIARLEQVATDNREGLRKHLTEMLARVDEKA